MKKIILLSVFVAVFFAAKAQDPIFVKGDKVINVGVGIDYYANISASGEVGILDGIADKGTVGVGAFVGFGTKIFNSKYYNYSHVLGGVRGTFHYPFIDKLDTYGGLGIGLQYTHWSWDNAIFGDDYSDNSVGLNSGFFVGARYYLSSKFAVFGELGYGLGYLNVGIAYKL